MTPVVPAPTHITDKQRLDTHEAPHSPSLLEAGPITDRAAEIRSIYQIISDRIRTITRSCEPPVEPRPLDSSEQEPPTATHDPSPSPVSHGQQVKTFLNLVKEHCANLAAVRSLGELAEWACTLVKVAVEALRLPERTIAKLPIRVLPRSPTPLSESQVVTFHGQVATAAPSPKERLEIEAPSEQKPDYTAQALASVAEATRKQEEHEKSAKAGQIENERLVRAQIRATIERIDAEGGINPDLSAILAQFDGTYGSSEIALRQIEAAQVKERKRKAL